MLRRGGREGETGDGYHNVERQTDGRAEKQRHLRRGRNFESLSTLSNRSEGRRDYSICCVHKEGVSKKIRIRCASSLFPQCATIHFLRKTDEREAIYSRNFTLGYLSCIWQFSRCIVAGHPGRTGNILTAVNATIRSGSEYYCAFEPGTAYACAKPLSSA